MKGRRALLAGLAGALAMSIVMWIFRAAGVNTGLETILGSLIVPTPGPLRWLTGFGMHLAMGAAIGWFYAAIFEFAVQSAGPLAGGGVGLSHGLLAGLFMSGIADMNPYGGSIHTSAGAFFANISTSVFIGPAVFLLLHVLFGAVTGMVYGHPVQHRHVFRSDTTHGPILG